MKKNIVSGLFVVFLGVVVTTVVAYNNVGTHPTINGAVVDVFKPNFLYSASPLSKFKNYSFVFDGVATFSGPAVIKPGNWYITEEDKSKTPKQWIEHGGYSADEPEVFAALRHFYDPLGMKDGKTYLTNRGTYWEGLASNPEIDAKTWALYHPDNTWSWSEGLSNVKNALETTDDDTRDEYMAKAYRCLGETMHLLADMGCPVHVRNDSHAPSMAFGAMGDPDPYESVISDTLVTACKGGTAEPSLKTAFRTATTADTLFDTMALFTNENFFTNQTISGTGVEKIDPIITDQPAYPEPKLDDMEYVPEDFTFYKTFENGARVKMVKDHSYFRFRGYPYVDKECAESQASVLIPNIIEAGSNLMRLFIPQLNVTIESVDEDGTVSGTVTHTTDGVYADTIYYNGPVTILVNNTETATLYAYYGSFSGEIGEEIEETDKVKAQIDFGAIYVNSDEVSPEAEDVLAILMKCDHVYFQFSPLSYFSNGDTDELGSLFSFSWADVTWNGSTMSAERETDYGDGREEFSATVSSDGKTLQSISYKYTYKRDQTHLDPDYYWETYQEIEVSSVPIYYYANYYNGGRVYFRVEGEEAESYVTTIAYSMVDWLNPSWSREYSYSAWIEYSYIQINFTEDGW